MVIPCAIASYSLVGEKLQKSLEPLLATLMTDEDILLGKTISGLLVPLAAMFAGAILYMVLMDVVTESTLGSLYYPNWHVGMILLVVPLASLLSVELKVIISSRTNDVRTSQQLALLLMIPFGMIYFASEAGIFEFSDTNLLALTGVIFIIDIVLFFFSKALFQREEILTKWE